MEIRTMKPIKKSDLFADRNVIWRYLKDLTTEHNEQYAEHKLLKVEIYKQNKTIKEIERKYNKKTPI